MAAAATDHERLRALQAQLAAAVAEREQIEEMWLEKANTLDG